MLLLAHQEHHEARHAQDRDRHRQRLGPGRRAEAAQRRGAEQEQQQHRTAAHDQRREVVPRALEHAGVGGRDQPACSTAILVSSACSAARRCSSSLPISVLSERWLKSTAAFGRCSSGTCSSHVRVHDAALRPDVAVHAVVGEPALDANMQPSQQRRPDALASMHEPAQSMKTLVAGWASAAERRRKPSRLREFSSATGLHDARAAGAP